MSGRSLLVLLAGGLGLLMTPPLLWGQSQPAVMATQARLMNGGIPGQQPPSGPGQMPPSGPGQMPPGGPGQPGAGGMFSDDDDEAVPMNPAEKAAPVEQKVYEHQTISLPDGTFTGHEEAITSVYLVDNGTYGISSSKDKTARAWWGVLTNYTAQNNTAQNPQNMNRQNGNAASGPNGGMNNGAMNNGLMDADEMNAAGMNPNGMNTAAAAYLPPDAHTGQEITVLENGHKQPVSDVVVDSTMENIYTASYDGTVRHWVSGSWEPKHRFLGAQDRIWGITLDPSETVLAAACNDGAVYIWQAPSGKREVSKNLEVGPLYDLKFAPNGAYIAAAAADGTVRICTVPKLEEVAKLSGHQDAVYSLQFSADGQYLLTASKDKTARIWDSNGTEVCRFVGHTSALYGACFLSDRYVVTAGGDKTVRVWALPDALTAAGSMTAVNGMGMPLLPMGGEVTADSVFNDEEDAAETEKTEEETDKPKVVPKGKELVCYETDSPVFALSVTSQVIAAGGLDGVVNLWNLPGPLADYEASLRQVTAAVPSGTNPAGTKMSGPNPAGGFSDDEEDSMDDPGVPSGPRPSGPSGPSGVSGPSGPSGMNHTNGDDDDDMPSGPMGPPSVPGPSD